MDDFTGLYQIRLYKPEDAGFVISTFLRGVYYGNPWFKRIPEKIYRENYKHIAAYLTNGSQYILIACLPDDPDTILGYSISNPKTNTLHWVYVKKVWRQRKIAKSLIPVSTTQVSHLTELGESLMSKLPDAIFNPFSL
jgi:hypothetical protein